jgi:putative Mn2+ efflux pump MntP
MDITTIFVALSLAMDSFSVAITHGLSNEEVDVATALKIGGFFGFFQAIMPVFGWLAGVNIIEFIAEVDHWVAFGLLCVIGGRMIYESLRTESRKLITSLSFGALMMLSVATSIDALAIGLSWSVLQIPILIPVLLTGIITFSLSFVGVYIGKKFGQYIHNKIEAIGGLILIAIGVKILLEHL